MSENLSTSTSLNKDTVDSVVCSNCQAPGAVKRCSRCRLVWYCNEACQKSNWKMHKKSCIPETVQGVIIHCEGERSRGPFTTTEIKRGHPIYSQGVLAPLPNLVGVPLILYRHSPASPVPRGDVRLDNQIATYLMIATDHGFAPFDWQQGVGTVTVMRADHRPLTKLEIETIWMYHDLILDIFGDSPGAARAQMTPANFKKFCETYREECLLNGRSEFQQLHLPI